ncbi:adenylyl-sulfate kinase [Desulfofundulus thermosubterraneus]|uniref:Adenylyl-sulfate kinase n=1 Tax=Desulfofundulus thermosubterraneus DSM 16057 TaxID=1121432 RepID=A0A1M6LQ21_9FIRM|nr:adenylyl-sulfate kinase [Desulfofundulus thermosubterraneus]SHJ73162.1 adenylylsulfate kinase [Desulfofundulus thermosubterraneus DSM 16057]
MQKLETNVVWQHYSISKEHRQRIMGQKSFCVWFTGLPAAGKSTLANALECRLYEMGIRTYLLDGDNVRKGLCKDLGFSEKDRRENIRRVAEVAKLFVDAGIVIITAFISPYRADREMARRLFAPGEFIEVYVKCPLSECERRDPKGHYRKARAQQIPNFTGITAPYEEPINPEVVVENFNVTIDESVNKIMNYLREARYLLSLT